jgi:cytochrome c2
MSRTLISGVLAATVAGSNPAMATGGIPVLGREIAEHWCAACHIVSEDQQVAVADVPSFFEIAQRRSDRKDLARFLSDPHPVMPDMNLTNAEVDHLVAYIASLRKE